MRHAAQSFPRRFRSFIESLAGTDKEGKGKSRKYGKEDRFHLKQYLLVSGSRLSGILENHTVARLHFNTSDHRLINDVCRDERVFEIHNSQTSDTSVSSLNQE